MDGMVGWDDGGEERGKGLFFFHSTKGLFLMSVTVCGLYVPIYIALFPKTRQKKFPPPSLHPQPSMPQTVTLVCNLSPRPGKLERVSPPACSHSFIHSFPFDTIYIYARDIVLKRGKEREEEEKKIFLLKRQGEFPGQSGTHLACETRARE